MEAPTQKVSLSAQLKLCESNIELQKNLMKVFDDCPQTLSEMKEELRVLEVIRDTVKTEYLLEKLAKQLREKRRSKNENG